MTAHCTRCAREATVRVTGKFRNGHRAEDFRCKVDAPLDSDIGAWLLLFATRRPYTAREYRCEAIEPIETAVSA